MGGSNVDVDNLPSSDTLATVPGKKDGEIRVFKTGTTPEAYCWKAAESKWEKIGDVIMPGGRDQGKQYPGDEVFAAGEYDHIFDVELGDGVMRKLPFNNGDNTLVASDKFMMREGLPKGYVEQI